jgi:type II secretory pathway pseudopilin PulG
MIVALVVLLVVGLVAGLTVQSLLQYHRQTREEEQRLQAELLADSALGRAVMMLESDPAWPGETWQVFLGESSGENAGTDTEVAAGSGVAAIRIEKVAAEPDKVRIQVEAIFPNDPMRRAKAERDVVFTIPKGGENP